MKNIVPCKMCGSEFEYRPGPAGNARQLCDGCRTIADTKEAQELAEKTIIEGNKYLVGAPGRKDKYDPIDILVDGNIPDLEFDADRFICTVEMAEFVKRTGITGMEDGIVNFLDSVGYPYIMLFFNKMPMDIMKATSKHPKFVKYVRWAARFMV